MRSLVVYYSRTGTTKKVAEEIAEALGAELEAVVDLMDRSGPLGYLLSARDGMLCRLTELADVKHNPSDYDLVVIGTPVWAFHLSAPIRTYLRKQRDILKEVAFFTTQAKAGAEKAFKQMVDESGVKPNATLALTTKEVVVGEIKEEVKRFVDELHKSGY